MVKQKLIYTDNGKDVALFGEILTEDDFFISFRNDLGRVYRIGKKAVVAIKEAQA